MGCNVGQKHQTFWGLRTSFPPRDIHKNPRSMCARVAQAMAQFVLKIEKLSHIMGTAPIVELALAYGFHPRLWLLGPVSRKPQQLFGPVKPFLDHLYLKTGKCIPLKLLVWRKPLFIFRICEQNSWVIARFEILQWLYGPENFPGLSRNDPLVLINIAVKHVSPLLVS